MHSGLCNAKAAGGADRTSRSPKRAARLEVGVGSACMAPDSWDAHGSGGSLSPVGVVVVLVPRWYIEKIPRWLGVPGLLSDVCSFKSFLSLNALI